MNTGNKHFYGQDWKDKQSDLILRKTREFIDVHSMKLLEVVKDAEGDGHVLFSNKRGVKKINFVFSPTYDIIIEEVYPTPIRFSNLLKIIFLYRPFEVKYTSLKEKISPDIPIRDFETFIDEALNYIKENELL
ncbi:MAG: hypothetical protein KDD08_01945 [Mangrovimonas sp.]|nr:hypothetical protein [Mangrovimonas sp.]